MTLHSTETNIISPSFSLPSLHTDAELTNAFDNLETDEKDILQGYVDGVNEHLREVQSDQASLLPFEFVALGLEPEPWTVNQVLAWAALVQVSSIDLP